MHRHTASPFRYLLITNVHSSRLTLCCPRLLLAANINIVIRRYLREKKTRRYEKEEGIRNTHNNRTAAPNMPNSLIGLQSISLSLVIFINIQLIESERRFTTRRSQHETSAIRWYQLLPLSLSSGGAKKIMNKFYFYIDAYCYSNHADIEIWEKKTH